MSMSKRIYFLTIDNTIVDNYDIAQASMIVNGRNIAADNFEAVRKYALRPSTEGILKEITNPTVDMFLRHGAKVKAIKLYYDQHPGTSLVEAKRIIDEMAKHIKDEHLNVFEG